MSDAGKRCCLSQRGGRQCLKMPRHVIGSDVSGAMDGFKKIRHDVCIFMVPVFLDDSHDTSYRVECERRLMFEGTVKVASLAKAAKRNPCYGPEKEKIFSIAQILPGNANDF
jgi:hypothetical protein